MDDRKRAASILRLTWGGQFNLSKADYDWLEKFRTNDAEEVLDICQRVAGHDYNWREEPDIAAREAVFRSVR